MPAAKVIAAGGAGDHQLSERFTIRSTLYAGFGVIFVLWLASGFDLVRRLALVEEHAGEVSARAAEADQQLTTVRVRVLTASVYVRDALFDTTPGMARSYRDQIESARASAERALADYGPVSERRAERESFRQLRVELDAFWATLFQPLDWDASRRSAEAWTLLRERVIPKREAIGQILRRIQDLNRVALAQEQDEIRTTYATMRRRIWETSGLALIASLVVASVVTRYAGRLERQIRQQLLKDAENTRDLQLLSARLVKAQEDERRTIARELHDEIGQALTAVKVELSVAGRKASLTQREGEAFQEARRLADLALQQVRDLSQVLHPAMLDDLGLPETIAWYLNAFSARTGIRTDFIQDRMDERLAGEIETCLYRIVQEALTNVARHAGASQCRVYLQRFPLTVKLTVEDDGKGFDPAAGTSAGERRGLGLLGIEERVSGFRGSMKIDTAPGRGLRLTIELPAFPRQALAADPTAPATPEPLPDERT